MEKIWKRIYDVSVCITDLLSCTTQFIKNPPAMEEILVQILGQEDPLEKG